MTTTPAAGERIVGPDRAPAALLDVRAVAALLDCAPRTVHRLRDAGRMPRPVRIGSLVRWRRADVLGWIDAGCPAMRSVKGGAR